MLQLFHHSCVLQVGMLGLNFKTAHLDLREEIARGASSLSGEKGLFFHHPTIILSTCNRTEIYFAGHDLALIHSDLLARLRSLIQEPFEHGLYSYFGIDCFTHLSFVTSGLDSAILAETEIQGQVKQAYLQTKEHLALPSGLHYIFQKALKIGKAVRNQFLLPQNNHSLFSVIWDLCLDFFDREFRGKVLFVGYSALNRLLIASFLRKKVDQITLCTNHVSPIDLPCAQIVGREILSSWRKFDLVICASRADQYLIQGPGDPRCLIFDLSVPRNVDPVVGQISKLYNIQQLNLCLQKTFESCKIEEGQEFVRENVQRLVHIYQEKQIISSHSIPS